MSKNAKQSYWQIHFLFHVFLYFPKLSIILFLLLNTTLFFNIVFIIIKINNFF